MSDGNTYESPIVHAIDGAADEELLESARAYCSRDYCGVGTDFHKPPNSSCAPPTANTYCAAASVFCAETYCTSGGYA
ncbi:MAG: hypothetical protein LBD49_03930 [Oscillospiraceae bacterium]|jgi:hypothetical protein|nr:hypothetical protein [Oscillospiraceae bacterium]